MHEVVRGLLTRSYITNSNSSVDAQEVLLSMTADTPDVGDLTRPCTDGRSKEHDRRNNGRPHQAGSQSPSASSFERGWPTYHSRGMDYRHKCLPTCMLFAMRGARVRQAGWLVWLVRMRASGGERARVRDLADRVELQSATLC